MSGYWEAPDDYALDYGTWTGSAHSVSGDKTEKDIVEQLRDAVEDTTGKPVQRQERRMGFL